jgi:hypothetical protein
VKSASLHADVLFCHGSSRTQNRENRIALQVYAAFFAATPGIMKKLASEQTWFPGDVPGFFGVLHTWGRQLQYHPHIRYVVPGGAFSSDDHSRHPCRKAFYLPVRVAANLFLLSHKPYGYSFATTGGFLQKFQK